jgi:hypothetical protein
VSGSGDAVGAVYVFTGAGGVWTQTAELTDSASATGAELGYAVAISPNGQTIAAGEPAGTHLPGDPNPYTAGQM